MITLRQIADCLNVLPPAGSDDVKITGLAMLADAKETDLSFLGSDRYLGEFSASKAAAFVVQTRVKLPPHFAKPVLIVDDADLGMAKIAELFAPPVPRPPAGIDQTARISPTVAIGENVAIGPFVCIGAGTRIGAGTVLHAGVFIGDDCVIGENCELFANVVVRERCRLGNRVIVHANSAIGSDGFGYRWDGEKHAKIPQIGTVEIEDDVEIGSCSCVDRAKFGVTRVGRGTKIDNLVQIAHNAKIGPHCIFAGQSGVAGSVTLGTGAMLGGQCAVRDHVILGDGAMLGACSGAMEYVPPKQLVTGLPAIPYRQYFREQAALRELPDLRVEVRRLREELEAVKNRISSE